MCGCSNWCLLLLAGRHVGFGSAAQSFNRCCLGLDVLTLFLLLDLVDVLNAITKLSSFVECTRVSKLSNGTN
jgi:hypothetical protein